MATELQLSSRSAAAFLAQIFGPDVYDVAHFGGGTVRLGHGELMSEPLPAPWQSTFLNPRPLPPSEAYALALAEAHVQELVRLDRLGALSGGEVEGRAVNLALDAVAEIEMRSPHWPTWPKAWPSPHDPGPRDTMGADELFIFGSLLLSAAELMNHHRLRDALAGLGERLLRLSMDMEGAPVTSPELARA